MVGRQGVGREEEVAVVRDGKERALECDQCGEQTDPMPEDEFQRLVSIAKTDGWDVKLQPDGWAHTCPSCRADDRLASARAKFGF